MPYKTIVAMLCITALAITAMLLNINGAILATAVGCVAGLGGYFAGKKQS